MKGFALGLALKQRRKATRKSPNTYFDSLERSAFKSTLLKDEKIRNSLCVELLLCLFVRFFECYCLGGPNCVIKDQR